MREIKFRAYDFVEKHWIYVELLAGANFFPTTEHYYCGRNISDWLEFTGIKDKNGKEIYEGDIIKYLQHPTRDKCKGVVQITTRGARFGGGQYSETNGLQQILEPEVIGNIYENGDLLDNGKQ